MALTKPRSRPKLTAAQLAEVRSLVADSGFTRAEAVALVLAGCCL